MADTEKQLKRAIEAAENWTPQRSPYSLENALLDLNDADQSQHDDLWKALRRALADNNHLDNMAPSQFFDRPFWAREGYWWWDPSKWIVRNES